MSQSNLQFSFYFYFFFYRQKSYFSKENVSNDKDAEKTLHFLMRLMVIMIVAHISWRP